MESVESQPDVLDKTIKFLAKRDGIDKALKIIRYTSKLLVAVAPADSEARKRFSALDSSVGVSRKAFRLGKFLQDVNSLRKSKTTGQLYLLEAIAYGGEGVYYFIEQIVWLMKTGALSKAQEKELGKISAYAELLGYIGSISLSAIKLRDQCKKHSALVAKIDKLRKEEGHLDVAMEVELRRLSSDRVLRVALIVQDMADATTAINDIRGGVDPVINHPVTLALAGLISAFVSSYKNWNA